MNDENQPCPQHAKFEDLCANCQKQRVEYWKKRWQNAGDEVGLFLPSKNEQIALWKELAGGAVQALTGDATKEYQDIAEWYSHLKGELKRWKEKNPAPEPKP